jgi:hypothetical protein
MSAPFRTQVRLAGAPGPMGPPGPQGPPGQDAVGPVMVGEVARATTTSGQILVPVSTLDAWEPAPNGLYRFTVRKAGWFTVNMSGNLEQYGQTGVDFVVNPGGYYVSATTPPTFLAGSGGTYSVSLSLYLQPGYGQPGDPGGWLPSDYCYLNGMVDGTYIFNTNVAISYFGVAGQQPISVPFDEEAAEKRHQEHLAELAEASKQQPKRSRR